ncbi:uncharacterized protein LOC124956564 [Vespa velutina]|uniref:uncharacterized protein LOC124956564 n=1 Tax=Vespa velutina TaxID=202808 RepID=UPI001FB325FA|nr:uncharacterized protein LOC124956564 [Vespa velutina]
MNKKESYGQTPFWRRKIRILHSHLDVNKDGIINYDDFMLQIERFSKIRDFSTEATIEFIKILTTLWGELWREVNPYNLISIEKYIEEMHHVLNDPCLKKKCHSFLLFLFKICSYYRIMSSKYIIQYTALNIILF